MGPFLGMNFWVRFWGDEFWGLFLGSVFWTNFGGRFWGRILGSVFGDEFWVRFWGDELWGPFKVTKVCWYPQIGKLCWYPPIGKLCWYPHANKLLQKYVIFNKAINLHSRGPTEQYFYVWEPHCGCLHKVKKVCWCLFIGEGQQSHKYGF